MHIPNLHRPSFIMQFRNPVAGYVYPLGSAHPSGTFVVTRPFGDMSFPQYGPHDGLDIGNGRCGDPILAMAPGRVRLQYTDANGANVVVLDHGGGWESGYAHLSSFSVTPSAQVAAGQEIGKVGMTGAATACHLHYHIALNGKRLDPALYLNGGGSLMEFRGLQHVVNRKTTIGSSGANFRSSSKLAAPVIETFGSGVVVYPVATITGDAAGGATPTLWYVAFMYVAAAGGYEIGVFHSSVLNPLQPNEATDDAALQQALAKIKASDAALQQALAKISAAKAALG